MNDNDLKNLVTTKILTGGRRTSASNEREVYNAIIDNKLNIEDIVPSAWGSISGLLADQTDLITYLNTTHEKLSNKGAVNGYAPLNGSSLIDAMYLPSFVDDVIEVANFAALPITGETGKIYVTIDNGNQYRWSGTIYVQITNSSSVWGNISGTITTQTDLTTYLSTNYVNLGGSYANPSWITSLSYTKITGGISSQFVKADGSLDSSTYLTTTTAATTYLKLDASNSPITGQLNLSNYLNLSSTYGFKIDNAQVFNYFSTSRNLKIGGTGFDVNSAHSFNTAAGYQSQNVNNTAGANKNSSFGASSLQAMAAGTDNSAFGYGTLILLNSGVGGGNSAFGSGAGAALLNGALSTFLGCQADTALNSVTGSIALGFNSIVRANKQLSIGDTTYAINEMYLGSGLDSPAVIASDTFIRSNGYPAVVSNQTMSGSNLWIDTTPARGTGTGGKAGIRYAVTGASGTTLQTLAEAITVWANTGNIGFWGSSFGGGTQVQFWKNAGTVPTTNPTGGIIPYVESDVMKYKQPAGTTVVLDGQPNVALRFVYALSDLPSPSGSVITLASNTTYYFCTTVDLVGNRIVAGANTTILGASSENCRIKSTGLSASTALISSAWSMPLRNITIEHGTAINLDATANANQALDWSGVNFTDCAIIGTVKNYTNFIMNESSFLNSQGLTFDGSIGTIGFDGCLFDTPSLGTAFIIPDTLTITRRFRIIYSSFVVLSGEAGINFSALATVSDERYILDTVNFSGGGTYIAGVTNTSNKALYVNCVGIDNTAVNGQIYMNSNAVATTIALSNTFYKVLGTTTASPDNAKYTATNNRLTCDATVVRKYLIQCNLSFDSSVNNVCEFGFYDSKLGAVRTPSRTKSTANSAGRAENVSFNCVVTHSAGDYLEIHTSNTTGANNITVSDMNFVITEL